ncbi:MAG TPA: hypothetical protein VJ300_04050 [Thermoplasmata archaeon]|nr:hypothetical protein [Thermoplasmata archaeon]
MGDLLNFNPDRALNFDLDRPLAFEPGRSLGFNPGRDLKFETNRDLGFGRRGVVFRGFVCPICGAVTTEDAPSCTECGAAFDVGARAATPTSPATSKPEDWAPTPTPASTGPRAVSAASPTGVRSNFCAFCGVKLKTADTFCWNCGARAVGPTESVRLPTKKTPSDTRDWRGPKER